MAEESPTGGAPNGGENEGGGDPPRRAKKRVDCGYCGCSLDADGEIISMGRRAKEFRALAENDETRLRRIESLENALRDAIAKLRTYENEDGTPKVSTPTSGGGSTKKKSVLESVVGG